MVKFFLSFLQSEHNHPIPAYSFWQYYIKNGIEEGGHQWTECPGIDWAFGLVPKSKHQQLEWKEAAWDKTVAWLKKNPADLFLSYLYPNQIDITAIREIQKMGIPCVNFFCDHVREFKKVPIEFGIFDLNWVPEHKAINLYQKADYPYIHLPMPMWVEPQLRVLPDERIHQITFIGSKDIQRYLFLEKIIVQNPNLPLAIFGTGWDNVIPEKIASESYSLDKKLIYQYSFIKKNGVIPYLRKLKQRNIPRPVSTALKTKIHEAIDFKTYNKLTAESMITLGINRYPSYYFPLHQPNTYSRLRDIEAPMLGACYLTEWTQGIEDLYNVGTEIEVYKKTEDLIEKVKELKADEKKRTRLRINGQKRALQDHTIVQSLHKILQKLNN